MGENGRAIALDMLIEPDAGAGLGYDRCERGLADFKRIAPQVVAIQLDQVESVQKHAVVSAVVTNEIERGNAEFRMRRTVSRRARAKNLDTKSSSH
jgi:hypothetical protein